MVLIDSLHFTGLVNAFAIGLVLLLIKHNGKHDSKYLGLFLICLGLAITNELFGDYATTEFHFLYPFKFFFLLPNLIYLHIGSKITSSNTSKRVFVNLLPGITEFSVLLIILVISRLELIDSTNSFYFFFDEIYTYTTIAYTIYVQFKILRILNSYNRSLFNFSSTVDGKYLNWLKWGSLIIIFNEVYYTLFYLISDDVEADNLSYLVYVIIEVSLILYISIGSLLQANSKIEVPLLDQQINGGSSYKLEEEKSEASRNFIKIEAYMKSHQPYLNSELNLKLFSQQIGISERELSNAINKEAKQNFYSYVNQHRVEMVKNMLQNGDEEKYSIIGIGEAAGFNSKSSFYNNFKKITDLTPSQYLNNLS